MAQANVVVVTGGGGGMGLACARRLARDGRKLLLADVSRERLDEAAKALAGAGSEVECVEGDLADPEIVVRIAAAAKRLGPLEALVHTAGLSPTMASGDRIFEVNLVASARLLDAFLPLAIEGSVAVCIASQAGHFARAGVSSEVAALLDDPLAPDIIERLAAAGIQLDSGTGYALSKLGVIRAVVRLAPEWGARGARIVSLSPGIIDTEMGQQEATGQPFMKTIVEKTPLGRKGTADEIAGAVGFLCSEAASFVTGTDLLVDGGSTGAVLAMREA